MKRQYFPLFLFFLLLVSACGNKSTQPQETSTEPEMVVTEKDSTEILALTRDFMDAMKAKEYDKATNMLYNADPEDLYAEPWPLTDDEKKEITATFKLLPIEKYSIEELSFKAPFNTQARIKIWIDEDISSYYYLNFIRYLGQWKTCVKNELVSTEM